VNTSDAQFWQILLTALAAVFLLVILILQIIALMRARNNESNNGETHRVLNQVLNQSQEVLRTEISNQARSNRTELSGSVNQLAQGITGQMGQLAQIQNNQIDGFALQLSKLTEANEIRLTQLREQVGTDARANREETASALKRFSDNQERQLTELRELNERKLGEVRTTLETQLKAMQTDNAGKLEEMRKTVDEKLHATLEQRLGESFKLVSERLEQVHRGLGEMQSLATGVGDLKRVLGNVKTRGIWGEVQLQALLEQVLTQEQYEKNVATRPNSNERVEFAVRLPGRGIDMPVRLPIDAKFPREDYERLLDAQERADGPAAEEAGKQLEMRIRMEAKTIRDKYIEPPHTTDFALMFLPTEGLYAEVLRRPGLTDDLQRLYRVSLAGPTTLSAILNSLQMGFRTLAIEQRSSEVWTLLGAVKTEFGKFGDVLAKTRAQLQTVTNSLDSAEVRSRAITRKLKGIEALPEAQSQALLPDTDPDFDKDTDQAGG
jgi:DNA recombination protein RmuC